MSIFDIIFLIIAIALMAAAVGAFVSKEQKSLQEMTKDYYHNQEQAETPTKEFKPRKVTVARKEQVIEEGVTTPKKKKKYYPNKKA